MDFTCRCSLARFAIRLWRPEERPSSVLPLARQECMRKSAGDTDQRSRLLQMTDNRGQSHHSAFPRCRYSRWESRYGLHKRGGNRKIHLAMDAHGIPVRMLVTAGSTVDCSQASTLIGGIDEQYLLADKGYNSDIIRAQAKGPGMEPVNSPRKNRRQIRDYNQHLY